MKIHARRNIQLLTQEILHERAIAGKRLGLDIVRLGESDFLLFLLALVSILGHFCLGLLLFGQELRLELFVLLALQERDRYR